MSGSAAAVITILSLIGTSITLTWILLSAILSINKTMKREAADWINRWWTALKWPTLVSILLQPVASILMVGHLSWGDYFAFIVNLVCWYLNRDAGDDDFTRKLKKKLDEVVEQVGGKLVVVAQAA